MHQRGESTDQKSRCPHITLRFEETPLMCLSVGTLRQVVKRDLSICWCYVKMSWGNCYVKVSCPHGDFHVEPEGVASSRTVEGGQRGPDHQWPGGDGAASQCPPGPATQGALPGGGGPRPAAWQSRAAVAAAAGRCRARADRPLDEDGVRGLPRHAPDGETR